MLSSSLNPIIKGMRKNRHNELVRLVRDAILHSNKGNAKINQSNKTRRPARQFVG
jgi:hypothetical protein